MAGDMHKSQTAAPASSEIASEAARDFKAYCARRRLQDAAPDLLAALQLALPYVDRVAQTRPTQPAGMQRQMEASKAAENIRAAIARAEGRS